MRFSASASGVKAGTIVPFAGATAPDGFLLCYGQNVSRTLYAALFDAIGTAWGAGDGVTTFGVPDLRGRAPFGKDNMGGVAANRVTAGNSGITGTTLGAVGGDERLHAHNHANGGTSGPGDGSTDSQGWDYTNTGTTGAGNSQNMPPAVIVNYIIKT